MSQNYNMLYTNEQKFVNMVAYTEKTYISFSEGGWGGGGQINQLGLENDLT